MTEKISSTDREHCDISFLVCTYNRARHVEACVKHLLSSQTEHSFEVIVRDNASNDNTKEIIEGIKDTRLKYVRAPENQGGITFLEIGKLARGEIMTWLSDEDNFEFCHLEFVVNTFRDTPECNVLIGSVTVGMRSAEVLFPERIIASTTESYLTTLSFSGCGGVFIRRTSFEWNCNFNFKDQDDAYVIQNFYPISYLATMCLDKKTLVTTSKFMVHQVRHAPTTDNWSEVRNDSTSKEKRHSHYYPESIFDRLHSCLILAAKKNLGAWTTIKIALRLGVSFIRQIDALLAPSRINLLAENYPKNRVDAYLLHVKRKRLHYFTTRKLWTFFKLASLVFRLKAPATPI